MEELAALEEAIASADALYTADIVALNNSGVTGTVILGVDDSTLSVGVVARGLTPDQTHLQHIHGRFDEGGEPRDSVLPVAAQDADLDGYIEVAEGAEAYGPILLPLATDDGPSADAGGAVRFFAEYDLEDDSLFMNPLSGESFTGDDITPLELREYVIHGLQIDATPGEGTDGSIDGTAGYKQTLPVGAGEIEEVDRDEALDRLEDLMQDDDQDTGGDTAPIEGTAGDDTFEGIEDGRAIFGGAGRDTLVLEGVREDYAVARTGGGAVTVEGPEGGSTRLQSVERIEFDDSTLLIEDSETATDLFLLRGATVAGGADEAGFLSYIDRSLEGETLDEIADQYVDSNDFDMLYGDELSDPAYVNALYENVLGRDANQDTDGRDFWVQALAVPSIDRGDLLVDFALSEENRQQEQESLPDDGFFLV